MRAPIPMALVRDVNVGCLSALAVQQLRHRNTPGTRWDSLPGSTGTKWCNNERSGTKRSRRKTQNSSFVSDGVGYEVGDAGGMSEGVCVCVCFCFNI